MRDVSRETEQGRGDVSRETKEGGVPESGGGFPSLQPADLAFSLPFCPHPPDPLPPWGRGRFFCFLMQGAPPLASPALSRPRHLQSQPLRRPAGVCPVGRLLTLPLVCFSAPIPPCPPSPVGKGEIFGFLMQGAPPLASPGLNLRGTGYAFRTQAHKYYQSTLLSEMPLSMHIYESSGGFGGLFQESPDVSFPQKVGIRGRESFEMLLQRKGKCGIL